MNYVMIFELTKAGAFMKNVFLLLLLIPSLSFSQKAVPELWGTPVHDEAGILSASTISQLEAKLKAFEDSTSNQVAILIVKSLDGEVLEEYSLRVAHDEWKLGQADKDNGVLLLIAIDDRKMRIEVGEGLEGPLPDVICNQIIRNEITPNFRRQDYETGVNAGVDAILKAIAGEYLAESFDGDIGLDNMMTTSERIFVGLFVFGILGIFVAIGLFTPGCAGWGLYGFLMVFFATFPMVIFGVQGGITTLITYAIGFPILKFIIGKSAWGKKISEKMKNNSGGRSGGGWSSGSGWSSGGGGWSSGGGGGFSGGGGSFGGGGSSGSW